MHWYYWWSHLIIRDLLHCRLSPSTRLQDVAEGLLHSGERHHAATLSDVDRRRDHQRSILHHVKTLYHCRDFYQLETCPIGCLCYCKLDGLYSSPLTRKQWWSTTVKVLFPERLSFRETRSIQLPAGEGAAWPSCRLWSCDLSNTALIDIWRRKLLLDVCTLCSCYVEQFK